jgi:hypothetical protein
MLESPGPLSGALAFCLVPSRLHLTADFVELPADKKRGERHAEDYRSL